MAARMRSNRTSVLARTCVATLAIAMLIVARPASGQTPAPAAADSDASLERARVLFHARKYVDAIALVTAYLAAHPRDARAYVLRGDAKASLDLNIEALGDYDIALGIAPEYEYGYVTRCQTRHNLGDNRGALEDCNAAIRLDGTDGLAYQARGDAYFDLDQYDAAIADYDRAVAHGEDDAYTYGARCDANRAAGRLPAAAADCDRALVLDPKSTMALWSRARLRIVSAQWIAAIADLNSYIALGVKDTDTAYYFRGAAYNRAGKYDLALDDLNRYVSANPSDGDGYRERGIARAGLQRNDAADADFTSAIAHYRHNADEDAIARVKALVDAMHGKIPLPMPPP
jgi:tetratricopeptide (TPR) repeat protein